MTLPKEALNHLWQSGYCRTAIDQLRHTPRGSEGTEARIEVMRAHLITGCQTCQYANLMKELEKRLAEQFDAPGLQLFANARDLSRLPGFQHVFDRMMHKALRDNEIGPDVISWVRETVRTRYGRPYPFANDTDKKGN